MFAKTLTQPLCIPNPTYHSTNPGQNVSSHLLGAAKVPCKHVVELAKAEALSNRDASRMMRRFARIPVANAEKGVHQVLKEANLLCPIQVSEIDLGAPELQRYPYVKLSSWIVFLMDTKRLTRQMTGIKSYAKMELVLTEFWARYRTLKPNHKVFDLADAGRIALKSCIPFFTHTDEGRSYKHAGFWVMSSAGSIGRGTRSFLKRKKHREPLSKNEMGLNFIGSTFSTNFIFACMLRTVYQAHPQALDIFMTEFAQDAQMLLEHGVRSSDGKHHVTLAHLATKGDLPALVKIGGLKRSFSHVPRAPQSKKACLGVCHLCNAGQEMDSELGLPAIPFEDVRMDACWIGTIGKDLPWDDPPQILAGLDLCQEDAISFFATDLWHNLHLGVAKQFIGSAWACIVESDLGSLPRASIDGKFAWVTEKYRAYFKSKKISPYIGEISRDTLNFPQSKACPSGKWSKGAASTQMMIFLGFFAKEFIVGKTENPILKEIVALYGLSML